MLSLSRRQLLIGGLAGFAVPAVFAVSPSVSLASPGEKLILSGRVVASDGQPLCGTSFAIGGARITTDSDGRFMVVTDTAACSAAGSRRDSDGTWRATIKLRL